MRKPAIVTRPSAKDALRRYSRVKMPEMTIRPVLETASLLASDTETVRSNAEKAAKAAAAKLLAE